MAREHGEPQPTDQEPQFPQANIAAVSGIAGVLGTTLGPAPRDKLVLEQLANREETNHPMEPGVDEFTVASDGERLLDALPLEHPVAPLVQRMVGPDRPGETDTEGEQITDGVTSKVVLAAALLGEAERLVEEGIHPTAIADGYRRGLEIARTRLDELSTTDGSRAADEAVARTAMTGNDVGGYGDTWASLAVDAVDRVGMPDEKSLVVRQTSDGSVADTHLVDGTLLDRNSRVDDRMPARVEDASVLVIGGTDPGGLTDPEPRTNRTIEPGSSADVGTFDTAYANRRRDVVDTLVELDVDVVVTQQGISPEYKQLLVDHGIVGVRGVNSLDLEQLASATGARTVLDPTDVEPADLGHAGIVESETWHARSGGETSRDVVTVAGCEDPDTVTVVLRGVSGQVAEYATTEIRKAAYAVALARGGDGRSAGIVPGGGAADVAVAMEVRDRANEADSHAQLALAAFADAVERLPARLVRNGGEDPIDVLTELRHSHDRGDETAGFVHPERAVADARAADVVDPLAIRRDVYQTAVTVSNRILRIDDAIDAVATDDEPDADDVIYEEEAEKQQEFLETGEL